MRRLLVWGVDDDRSSLGPIKIHYNIYKLV